MQAMDEVDPYIRSRILARRRPAVVKIRFLNYRSKYPSGLIIAVEGDEDKIVYSHWISRISSQLRYEFFVCGGKRGVRQLRNALYADRSGNEADVLFFVDRDYDDLSGFDVEDQVFMLDRYSIENYLVDGVVLDQSLRAAFPGDGDPAVRSRIREIFQHDYKQFLCFLYELNWRIFVARRFKYDIDDMMPDNAAKFVGVCLGRVTDLGAHPAEAIPFDSEPSEAELDPLRKEFEMLDPVLRHRGKFAIKFFRCWLDCLRAEFRNPEIGIFGVSDSSSGKVKTEEFSIGSFASRSPIPHGLGPFLEGNAS
jgi:hypothetical protein